MAPEHAEVVIAPQSFDRSGSGSITGAIWLRHGARGERRADFPEPGWTDFPVVILAWWLDALGALARGETGEASCLFMVERRRDADHQAKQDQERGDEPHAPPGECAGGLHCIRRARPASSVSGRRAVWRHVARGGP